MRHVQHWCCITQAYATWARDGPAAIGECLGGGRDWTAGRAAQAESPVARRMPSEAGCRRFPCGRAFSPTFICSRGFARHAVRPAASEVISRGTSRAVSARLQVAPPIKRGGVSRVANGGHRQRPGSEALVQRTPRGVPRPHSYDVLRGLRCSGEQRYPSASLALKGVVCKQCPRLRL